MSRSTQSRTQNRTQNRILHRTFHRILYRPLHRALHRPLQSGFSLFELVVFILSVAIIYSYAAQRFSSYPGEAEKANFMAVTTQLQSSLTLQTFTAQLNGGVADMVSTLEGGNPMALMLRPPRNYLGALDEYRLAELPRRSWFFDVQSGELVYLIGENGGATLLDGVAEFATDEIRLKIIAEYSLTERSTGLPLTLVEGSGREPSSEELSREFNGLVLAPVTPFRWRLGG